MSAGALGVMLSQSAGSACVPPSVVPSTIKAAILFAAGQAAAGLISVQVAALTEGVLAAMFLSKIKVAMGVLLVALVFTGTGVLISQATGSDGQEKNPQSTRRGIQEQKASQGGQTGKQVQKTTASVREIADIFGTNAALADEKFAGKQIAVTGRMRFIRAGGVTIDGKQVYDLYMGSEEPDLGRGPVVQFRFVVDDRKQLAKLRAWQRLTIEVKAKDYQVGSAGVCFSECIIMSVED